MMKAYVYGCIVVVTLVLLLASLYTSLLLSTVFIMILFFVMPTAIGRFFLFYSCNSTYSNKNKFILFTLIIAIIMAATLILAYISSLHTLPTGLALHAVPEVNTTGLRYCCTYRFAKFTCSKYCWVATKHLQHRCGYFRVYYSCTNNSIFHFIYSIVDQNNTIILFIM